MLQGLEAYADELRLESIFQVGSQVYIQVELWDDPETLHDETINLFSKEVDLMVPSFMVLLTENAPVEGSVILYQNQEWEKSYEIDQNNPLILTNDMEGLWDVSLYPWVYNEEFGWFYITPIAEIELKSGAVLGGGFLTSRYSRWIYKSGFGWSYKINYFPSFPDWRTNI